MKTPADPTIIRSDRKTLAIYVQPDASVVVKAPKHISMARIEAFLAEQAEWIQKRLAMLQQRQPRITERTYKAEETFLYLGNEYILTIGAYNQIEAKDGKILFPEFLQFRIQKELTDWYIRQARRIITEQVMYYAQQMQATYTDLTFSDTKSQWGRCTHDNRLQLSWRLVMAPLLTINYVVVHELAHTFQKNHSQGFWSKVRFYNPTYRQQRKWLETHGNILHI